MPIQIGSIKLYSLNEIAGPLKVNMITIRRYIREGRIKGQKVGQKWYVTEESLQEFFNEAREPRKKENSVTPSL